ncbi:MULTISPECIES: hypothetical protein [unclassified Acinetobacter]|uniref:hypothetical protein n=1 Tax=unclassified Acinetobacter TaxID=196816 RepID=UPI00293526EB|nr:MULTISPECIES: hypothetical protein [unclassified Acinetobacter]WOE32536.1 hypothetical protein QSG84_04870 [Acinetobacter sp. SAAs470]WOE38012.1 hypothetical protein QSG86_13925 [Acinetobacter sp. SAAs474]
MLKFIKAAFMASSWVMMGLFLQACDHQEADEKVVIQPAPKLTNDATSYAQAAWTLINDVDPLVYQQKVDLIEDQVRKPVRKLTTDWRIEVKMTDSVTEGKYALCRKALQSLDIWARQTVAEAGDVVQKQADYERDKAQCKNAIDHPQLGNTDPKKNGV